MSDILNLPDFANGMLSTDAIEQLDPFVPSSAVSSHRLSNRTERLSSDRPVSRQRASRRVVPASYPSGSMQVVVTCIPLLLTDLLAVTIAASIAAASLMVFFGVTLHVGMPMQLLALCVCQTAFACLLGLYPATGFSPVLELRQTVYSIVAAFATVLLLNALLANMQPMEVGLAIIGGSIGAVLGPMMRMVARRICARQEWWGERAVIIGAGPQGRALYRFYSRATERGLRPIGLIDLHTHQPSHPRPDSNMPYLGSIRRLERLRRRHRLRWAIVAPGGCEQLDMAEVMTHAGNLPNILILPSQFLLPSLWASTRECAGVMGVHLRDHLHSTFGRFVKRTHDLVLTIAGLIVLSPLLVIIALLIKWNSPGPVFYGHRRIGQGGEFFKAWKFRSMLTNADEVLEDHLENDPEMRRQWIEGQKLKNDPRIIPGIGHFLRKSSLDELPQLWNVLLGQMSLVGPRPIVKNEIERYENMYPLYLRVRPGITGLWQVSGRNDTSYNQRVRLDSYYVCNWSIWLDAYILLRTVRTMLFREGAY